MAAKPAAVYCGAVRSILKNLPSAVDFWPHEKRLS
jgi:hypothetical protein